jgi:hypothetical protein
MKGDGTVVSLYETHEELVTYVKACQKYKLTKNYYLHQGIYSDIKV